MLDDFKPIVLVNSRGVKVVVYSAEQLKTSLEAGVYTFSSELSPSTVEEVVSRDKERITAPRGRSIEG